MKSTISSLIFIFVLLIMITGCGGGPWISGTTDNKYTVEGETTQEVREDIFDSTSGKGPKSKDGVRRAGRTSVEYQFGITPGVTQKRAGELCSCTVSIKAVEVKADIKVTFPVWKNFDNASADCKAKWNEFIKNLKKHEEGHNKIYTEGKKTIETVLKNNWLGKSSTIVAPDCNTACDSAYNDIFSKVNEDFQKELKKIEEKDEKYDKDTKHGETQGAILKDCTK